MEGPLVFDALGVVNREYLPVEHGFVLAKPGTEDGLGSGAGGLPFEAHEVQQRVVKVEEDGFQHSLTIVRFSAALLISLYFGASLNTKDTEMLTLT